MSGCGETNFRSNSRINHLQHSQPWRASRPTVNACGQKYVIANEVSHDCQTLFHFAFSLQFTFTLDWRDNMSILLVAGHMASSP